MVTAEDDEDSDNESLYIDESQTANKGSTSQPQDAGNTSTNNELTHPEVQIDFLPLMRNVEILKNISYIRDVSKKGISKQTTAKIACRDFSKKPFGTNEMLNSALYHHLTTDNTMPPNSPNKQHTGSSNGLTGTQNFKNLLDAPSKQPTNPCAPLPTTIVANRPVRPQTETITQNDPSTQLNLNVNIQNDFRSQPNTNVYVQNDPTTQPNTNVYVQNDPTTQPNTNVYVQNDPRTHPYTNHYIYVQNGHQMDGNQMPKAQSSPNLPNKTSVIVTHPGNSAEGTMTYGQTNDQRPANNMPITINGYPVQNVSAPANQEAQIRQMYTKTSTEYYGQTTMTYQGGGPYRTCELTCPCRRGGVKSHSPLNPDRGAMSMHTLNEHQPMNSTFNHYFINRRALALNPGHKLMIPSSSHQHQSMNSTFNPHVTSQGVTALNPDHELWNPSLSPQLQTMNPTFNSQVTSRGALANPQHQPMNYLNSQPHLSSIHQHRMNFSMTSQTFTNPQPTTGMVGDPINRSPLTLQHQTMNPLNPQPHNARPPPCSSYAMGKPCVINPASSYLNVQPAVPMQNSQTGACKEYRQNYNRNVAMPRNPGYNSEQISKAAYLAALRSQEYLQNPTRDILGPSVPVNKNPRAPEKRRAKSVKTTKNIKATLAASQICTETMNNGASTSTLPFCTPTQSYPLPNWAAFGTQNDAPRKPTAKTTKAKVSNVKKTEDNNIEIPHIDLATDVTQKSNTNMTPKIMTAPFSIDTHKQTVNERIDTTQTNVTTTAHNMNAISLMQDSSNVEGQSKPMIMNVNNDGTPTYLMEAPTQQDRSSNDINQSQINTELPWIDMKSDGGYVQSETFLQQASDNIDIETAIALFHVDTDEAPGNAKQNSNALAKSTNAYELVSTSSVTTESTSHNIESNDIIMRTDTSNSVKTTKNIKATLAASQICTETMNNGASTSTLPFCTPTQSYPLPNWAAFGTQNDAPRKPTAKTIKSKVSNVKKTEDNNIEIPHIDLATDVTQKSNTNMTPKIMPAPFSIDTHKQTVNERIDTTQTNVTTTAHNMNAISLMQDSSNVEGQSKPMIMNVNNDGTPTYLMEAPTQHDRSSNDINQSQINTELPWIDMKSDGGYVQSETFLQQASDNIDIETAIALLHADTDEAPGNATQNSNALAKSTNAYELVSTSSVTTESTSHNIESNDIIMRTDTSNSVKTTKNIKATLAASQICTETMNNGASTSTLPFCTPTQSYPLPNWAAFGTQNDAPRKPTAKTTKAKVSNVKKTEDNNIEIPHIDLATDVTQKSYTNMTPKIMPAPFSIDTHKQTVNERIDTTQTNVTTTAHNMNAISIMQDSSNVEGQSKPMIMNVNNDGTPTYLMEAPTQHDRSSNDINQSQINTELPWIDMKSHGGYVQSETFLQQASDNIDIETAIALLHADTDEAPGNATQNSNALAKSTNAYELVSTSSVTTESTSHNIESNDIIMRTDTSNSVKTTKNIKATLAASQICTETMNNGASTSTLPFCTPTQSYPLPNWAAFGTQNDAPRKPTAKTIKAKVSNVKKTEDNNIEIPHIDLATDVTQKSNTNMTPKIMPAPFSIDTHKQTVNERIDTTQTNVTTTAHNMNAISLMQDSSNVEGKSKPMLMNVYNDGTPTYLMEAPTQHDRSSNDINQSQINTELPWIDMKSDGGYVQSETFLQQASDNIDIETAIALLHADTDEAPGNATQNSNALAKSTNAYELVSTSSVTTESTSHNIESNDIIMRTDTSNSEVHNNQEVNIKQIIENTVTVSRVKKIITNPNISLPKTETLLDILNKVHSTKEANTGENMEPTRTEDENKIKTTDAAVDDGSTKGIEEDDHQTKDVPDSKDDDILETARQNLARWSAIEHDNKNKRADYNTNTDTDVNVNVKISSSDSSSVQQEKFNMNCSIDKTTQLKSADSSEYNILPKLETKIENQLDINYAGESQEFKNIKNEEPESAKEELIIFKFQIKIFGLLSENNQEVYAQKLHNAIHDLITLSDYKDATADLKYEFHECHNVTIFSPRQFYQNGINYVKSLINSVYNCQFCPTFRRKYIEFLIKHIKLRTSGANLNTFSKQIGENTEINAQKLDTTTDLIIERQTNSKPALLNYESDSTNKSKKVCIVKEQRGLITADAPSSSKQVEIKDQKKHNNKNTPDSQNQTNFVVKLPLHMLKKSTVEALIQCKSSKSNDNKSDGVTATVHGNRNISTSLANNNNNKKHLSKRKTINAENAPSSNPDPRNINSNPSSNNNDSKIESHSEKEKSINETNPVLQKINAIFVSKNMADSDKNHTRQPKKRKSLSAETAPTTIPGTNTASDNIDDQNKIQDQHSKRKKSTCNITATITSRGAQNSKTSSVNNDDNDRNHERSSKKRKSPSGEIAPSKNTNVSKNNDKDHEGHSKRRKSISAESETRANQNDCHNNYKNKEKDRETTKNICGQLTTPEDIDTATKNNEEHETRQPNASKNISDETATSKNDESQKRKTITTSNNDSSNSSKEPCNPQINHANNKKDNNEVRKSIDSETTTNKNTERLNVQDNASNKNNNNDKNIARTSEATKSTKKQTTTGRNTTSTETTTNNNTEKQQSITLKIFRDHVSKNNDKDHEGHSKRRKSINAESETRANQNDCHNNYKNKERDRETTKNICGQLITPEDIDTATKNNEEHETRQLNASKNISDETATSKNDESQKRKTITTSNNDSSNSSKEPCRKIFRDHVESITRKNNDGEKRHNSINTDDEKAFHKSAKKLNAKEKDELPEVKIPGKKEHKGKNEKKVKNTTYIAKITDKYICSHCYVRYSSFPAFEKHSADNHKIVKIEPKDYTKMITCPFCPEDMIEKVFNKHVKDRHPDKHSQTINK
ncbi:uncharacterized protein LOC134753246 [Cydia strobilella]|uniref:uncharacterized protein LOC134753246 n=1 Tax=Cydia strobilella TaxID=1100964 RepID=UPI003004BAE5